MKRPSLRDERLADILRALLRENARLKRLVSDLTVDKHILAEVARLALRDRRRQRRRRAITPPPTSM